MNNSEYTSNTIQRRKYRILLFVLFAVVLAIFLCSFWIGYYPLSPLQVVEAFLSKFGYSKEILPQAVTIFWNIRQGFYRQLLSELPSQSQALLIKECSVIRLYRRIFSAYLPALVLALHLRS